MNSYPPALDVSWTKEEKWDSSYVKVYSLIKPGQIESTIWKIKELRENKEFELSDKYRDKLIKLGRMWHQPKISHHDEKPDKPFPFSGWLSHDCLWGHFDKILEYKIDENKNISIEGQIDFGRGLEEIYYATR